MQLDCFLESFLRHIKYPDYKVAVVYHTIGNHDKGYKLLIEKYKNNSHIVFYERSDVNNYFFKILPLLFYPRNLYRYIKYKYLRKNVDNFKFLVEEIIKNSGCEILMFSTDDTVYDGDIFINDSVVDRIRKSPNKYSLRLFLGENLIKKYNAKVSIKDNKIIWNYYENQGNGPWGGVFNVDGTVYNKQFVLETVKKLLYHMPATLESFTNTYIKRKKMLKLGFAPIDSCLSNIWINRVQVLGHHESLNIDVDYLNEKFLEGYKIKYKYDKPVTEWGTVPYDILFEKSK